MENHIRYTLLPVLVSTTQGDCQTMTTGPELPPWNAPSRASFLDSRFPSQPDGRGASDEERPEHVDNHRGEWATPLQ